MPNQPDRPKLEIGEHCQKLGILLYFVSLVLPVGYITKAPDEFGHTLEGFECLYAALASLIPTHSLPISLAAWVNPCTLLIYLIDNFGFASEYRQLIPYLGMGTLAGLIASYFALAHEQYELRFGYWVWIASILLLVLPTLYRWKLTWKPLSQTS